MEATIRQDVACVFLTNLALGGRLVLNYRHLRVPAGVVVAGARVVMDGPWGLREVAFSSIRKDERGRCMLSYPVDAIWTNKNVALTLLGKSCKPIGLHSLKALWACTEEVSQE